MVDDREEEISVGVEEIDARQRQVVRRMRHLVSATNTGHADEIRAAMRYLHTALSEHQALEEAWMCEEGYPAAREHGRAHAAILERLAAARADAAPGSADRLARTATEVVRTIEEHIHRDDLRLARFWVARENLRRLAENGPGVGLCLTPVPGTLPTVMPPPPLPPPADEPIQSDAQEAARRVQAAKSVPPRRK